MLFAIDIERLNKLITFYLFTMASFNMVGWSAPLRDQKSSIKFSLELSRNTDTCKFSYLNSLGIKEALFLQVRTQLRNWQEYIEN